MRRSSLPEVHRLMAARYVLLLLLVPLSPHSVHAQEPGLFPSACDDGATVLGTVRDAATGVTLPGARVQAKWTGTPGGELEAEADAEGRYRLCGLPTGVDLSLVASFAAVVGETVPLRVREGRTTVRDLELEMVETDAGAGRVLGRVTDRETGRPVQTAAVRALGTERWAETNRQGYFDLGEIPSGTYRVRVEHLGYGPVEEVVTVPANRTVDLQAQLSPDPVALEPIVVSTVRDRRLEIKGFYERKRWGERLGLGHFITKEEIERRRPLRITQMIAEFPGVELVCRGGSRCFIRMRRRCVRARVVVDGMEFASPDAVLPVEIGGVEIYKGPASAPAEFTGLGGNCGVVVIWTPGR